MARRPVEGSFDIRKYKRDLRETYRAQRKNMPASQRREKDKAIFQRIYALPEYTVASLVLCYVSTPEEINTHPFIRHCLAAGKKVAVPYCIDGTREMDFYYITSLDELERRTFGVLEPVAEKSVKVTDFSDALCILPGLTFDKYGYRLGYGGGYYDRFLSKKFNGLATLGVCYQQALRPHIIHGRYDRPCDYIVTETGVNPRQLSKPRRCRKKQRRNKG